MSPLGLSRLPLNPGGRRSLALLVLGLCLWGGGPARAALDVRFPGPIAFNALGETISSVRVAVPGVQGEFLAVGTGNGYVSLLRFFPGVENFSILESIFLGGRVTWISAWESPSAPGEGLVVATANPDQLYLMTVQEVEPYFNLVESVDLPEDPGSAVFVGEGFRGAGEIAVSLPGIDQVVIVRDEGTRWTISQTLDSGDTPTSLAAVDLDRDGTLEFVSADRGVLSGSIGVFRRQGDGSFTLASHHPQEGGVGEIRAFDADEAPGQELLVANADSARVLVLGWSADTLVELDRMDLTLPADHLYVAGFEDGSVGLYVAVRDRGLAEFYRRFGGTWDRVESYYPGCSPVGVTLCDFNGNGLGDLVCLGGGQGTGHVMFGNGAPGYFGFPALVINSVPGPSDLSDFDGDGLQDLVVAGFNKTMFSIFRGVPGGGFNISPLEQQLPYFAGVMTSFDANGDGRPDLAVADLLVNRIRILTYSDTDLFTDVSIVDPGVKPSAIVHRDLDLDGNIDIFMARAGNSDIFIAYGDGTGHFPDLAQVPVLTGASGVLAVDLNGDTLPDLVVTDGISRGWAFLNQGGRVFVEGNWVNLGSVPKELAAADMDGDFDLDIVVANHQDKSLTFLENDGSGDLKLRIGNHVLNAEPVGLETGDMDQNGFQDVLVNLRGEGSIGLVFGVGDWVFSPPNSFPAGVNITDFNVGDFNEDGILDVLSLDQSLNLGLVMLNVERTLVSVEPTALTADCVADGLRVRIVPDRSGPWALDLVAEGQTVRAAADGLSQTGQLDFDGEAWYLTLSQAHLAEAGLPVTAAGLSVRLTVGFPGQREFLELPLDRVCRSTGRQGLPPVLTWDRQPWPNPFNPLVRCRVSLGRPSRVTATIHDAAGRRVATLLSGDLSAGSHDLLWDGRQGGRPAAGGLYLLRVQTEGGVLSSKILLLK